MATPESRPEFCPRRAWSTSIDEVLVNVKMKKLEVREKKLLKDLREDREYLIRWRKAEKLKKEKQYLEERRGKIRRRLVQEEEETRRAEARRREVAKVVETQDKQLKSWRREEEKKRTKSPDGCPRSHLRSMDRSRTGGKFLTPSSLRC